MKRTKSMYLALVVLLSPMVANADTISIGFDSAAPGTIQDSTGQGTGLTDRLSGTGGSIATQDPNLSLDTGSGVLNITSTPSDINGQINLGLGEYLGVNLSSLGFTGSEDFSLSATFLNIQYSQAFDQFGLYIGADADTNFRAGYLFFFPGFDEQLFSVHNTTGLDSNLTLGAGPLVGSTLSITLGRVGGIYSLGFNGTDFSILQPSFLNGFTDLNVGIFAANSRNDTPKGAIVDSFSVTVDTPVSVPEPGTLALLGIGLFGMGLARRKRKA